MIPPQAPVKWLLRYIVEKAATSPKESTCAPFGHRIGADRRSSVYCQCHLPKHSACTESFIDRLPAPKIYQCPVHVPRGGPDGCLTMNFAGGVCLVGTGRSGDGVDPATYTPCPGCSVLPNQFRAPPIGTLDNFASADDLGEVLWHGSFHNGISGAFDSNSNRCNDAGPPRTSPRDSMFWRAHKALDDVHSDWQQL